MPTFLSLLGVAALLAAFLISLLRRTPETSAPTEQPTEWVSPISGDSRLPQGALFLPDHNA